MAQGFKPYKAPTFTQQNQGSQLLNRLNGGQNNFAQAEGLQKAQVFPEQTDERLENKFKALKSALARSTSGKPTK